MKRFFYFAFLLVIFTSLSGCGIFTPVPANGATPSAPAATLAPPAPPPTFTALPAAPTPSPAADTPAAPSSGGLSLELLKNFTYVVEDPTIQVSLKDGEFSGDHIHSQLIAPAAFGDLNGDGLEDAAVVLATNLGGSGTFYDLIAVLNQNGTPAQAGYSPFGDRQAVRALRIADGRVVLDYLTQGRGDPFCCPSEHRLRSYVLDGGALRLASEQVLDSPTAQATPLPNMILIDQPAATLDFLTNPIQLRGRVSQVPPEKKLEYDVTDMQSVLLMQGEVPLEGVVGGPGTFSIEITLDPPPTGIIKVELVDAANGILRGRSMVDLVQKQ